MGQIVVGENPNLAGFVTSSACGIFLFSYKFRGKCPLPPQVTSLVQGSYFSSQEICHINLSQNISHETSSYFTQFDRNALDKIRTEVLMGICSKEAGQQCKNVWQKPHSKKISK